MLVALGPYVPEGILTGAAETGKEEEQADHSPTYATDKPPIGDHMALSL